MEKRIIYKSESGVSLMIPYLPCGLTVLEIGQKDVPDGVPFWIVDSAEVPDDIPQEAWEINESTMPAPDGYGGTYEADRDD